MLALAVWTVLLVLTGPAPAAAEPLTVAVISDLNGAYGSTRYEASVDAAVARILALKPDLVISTGDMVAGQRRPHLSQAQVEAMWQSFHEHVTTPLAAAGIPLAVTPGNHDGSAYPGFERERRIYAEQWTARRPTLRLVDADHYPFHYAFAAGEVLFIALDATTPGHLPPAQMDWLRDLLEQHGPLSQYTHRVVFSHLPLWPFAQGREREYIGDPALARLLREGGVDLYLSGHHHAFYPGHKDGVYYVGQACLGAGPRKLIGTGARSPRSFTLLTFDGANLSIAALAHPGFDEPLDWNSLPQKIHSPAAVLTRADLINPSIKHSHRRMR